MGYLLPCIFKWLLNYAIVPKKTYVVHIYMYLYSLYAVNILEADNNALLAGPASPTSQCDSTNIVINT